MSGREIVLDTETTGLDPASERLVEVACVELVNHLPTGRSRQWYLNPERAVHADALRIHGLDAAFLADKPRFAEIAPELVAFVGDATLVIHNAEFDLGFLDAEFARAGLAPLDRSRTVDTLALARRRFPGERVSLDALCQRFAIDNSARTLHGALLDASLLADVYLELIGGRQASMALAAGARRRRAGGAHPAHVARVIAPSEAELAAHAGLVGTLKAPIWLS